MKKAVALAVAVLMAAGIFSGCTLVKVDAEADGNRVVAVVQRGKDIKKRLVFGILYVLYVLRLFCQRRNVRAIKDHCA